MTLLPFSLDFFYFRLPMATDSTIRLSIGLWIITSSPEWLQPTRNFPRVVQLRIRVAPSFPYFSDWKFDYQSDLKPNSKPYVLLHEG
ncbi:hypothetical protein HA466_0025850 [Hirschfeldia incana]|nr:hypothetical protein HA466_0025850 [Hirschfeldia incana]